MPTEEPKVNAYVDFGTGSGYFVRLDVEGGFQQGTCVWIDLTADEADALADRLKDQANQVRKATAEWKARREQGETPGS